MTALQRLGAFIATCSADERARAQVRIHGADTIGAWIAATGTPEGRALLAFRGQGAPPVDRLAVHCALARLSEVDDIHLAAMITPGSIVVPAALTIAASQPNAGADELAAAIVAGYEAMVRLGVAIDGPTVLHRGIWPSYFAAPVGVAAVAARLLRLDPAQTANALATALIMASPGVGHHAAPTTARWLAVGLAAGRGLQAALAAKAGFSSDPKLADGDFLRNVYGIAPNAAVLAEGWKEIALHQVSFKPWCAARQTMAATQALREVLAEGISPESIVAIEAAVLPQHLKMIDHGVSAGDRFSYLTSLPYQMAVAAVAPEAVYGLHPPQEAGSPAIAALMQRIEVRGDESLMAAGYPRNWPARVTVTTDQGRHERTVTHVPGDPARPFGEAELKARFVRVVAPLLDRARAEEAFATALDSLERPAAALNLISDIAGTTDQKP
jgi:2-methylcitrate dehydratase PrpD